MSSSLCTEPELDESASETNPAELQEGRVTRRSFVKAAGVLSAVTATGLPSLAHAESPAAPAPQTRTLNLSINGSMHQVTVDTRTSLLDTLREYLDLTGSKKGCDHGQCGACTVLVDGRRVNSCLTLAVAAEGAQVATIEGLAHGDQLHPMQQSFMEHDGYQCGYCTPGQICSAVAALDEATKGELSVVSYRAGTLNHPTLSDHEIRERMSGNLCRCGAYPNIVAAVRAVARQQGVAPAAEANS